MSECPFCARLEDQADLVEEDEWAAAFPDRFPVSGGHVLVVPRVHISRLEDLTRDQWTGLFEMVRRIDHWIAGQSDVDGVNVGFNSGEAAGQTVEHAHVHVIPRRSGDVPDPRGGIRWVLPEGADYWSGKKGG